MSFIWLVTWLIKGRPRVRMFSDWNNWGIALGVLLALDLLNAIGQGARGGRRMKKSGAAPTETRAPEPAPAVR